MYSLYVIQNGDTLEKIANEYNTSIEIIEKLNNNLYNAKVGTHLLVPNKKSMPYFTYKINKGETIYQIANKFNIEYSKLLLLNAINDGDYIYESQEIFIPNENIGLYMVNENDNLNDISIKLKNNLLELSELNSKIFLLPEQIIFYKKDR